MSRFQILMESILTEAKIDDAITKEKLDAGQAMLAKAVYTATGSKAKFANFIAQNCKAQINDLIELLLKFEQNLPRIDEKDINKYTVETLRAKMAELGESKAKIKQEISKDAPIVWTSDDGKIVIRNILSWEASKKYGAGTKWCITMKEYDGHWKRYTKEQLLNFYFITNERLDGGDKKYKLAVVISSDGKFHSMWNVPDTNIINELEETFKKQGIPKEV